MSDVQIVREQSESVYQFLSNHRHSELVSEVMNRATSCLSTYFYRTVLKRRRKMTQFFCARQHICYSAYMLSPVRLSVCLSVRLSHGWISQKRLKLGSCNFHHRVAPYDSSFLVVNFTAKFQRELRERGRQIREG